MSTSPDRGNTGADPDAPVHTSIGDWDALLLSGADRVLVEARNVLADASKSPSEHALAHLMTARAYFELGRQIEAAGAARLAIGASTGPVTGEIQRYIALAAAAILAEGGAVDQALTVLARLEVDAIGVDRFRVEIQTGYVLRAAGRLEQALVRLDRAQHSLADAEHDRDRVRLHGSRGVVLLELGRLDEARSDFEISLQMSLAAEWPVSVGFSHVNLAVLEARAHRLPESLKRFDQALAAFAEAGNPLRSIAVVETDRAGVLLHSGMVSDALAAARAVLRLVATSGNQVSIGDAELLVARCELAAHQPMAALASAERAAATLRSAGRHGIVAHADSVRCTAELDRCSAGGIVDQVDAAESVIDELRTNGWHDAADALLLTIVETARRVGVAAAAADAVAYLRRGVDTNDPAAQLRGWYAEAVARAEAGSVDDALAACASGLALVDGVVDSAPDLERRSGAQRLGRQLSDVAIAMALSTGDPHAVFGVAEGTRARAVTAEALPGIRHRSLSSDDAARMLEELSGRLGSTCLVMWIVVDGWVHALVVHTGTPRLVAVGPVKAVRRAHERIQLWLGEANDATAGSSADAERAAAQFDELVIAGLNLPADADVVMVPVGLLHGVTWAAAPSLRGRRVMVAPSAQLWLHADRRSARTLRSAALVCGPDVDSAAVERATFTANHPRGVVAAGAGATAASVRNLLASADLVHIAAHGSFRSDRPLLSTVRLSDGPAVLADVVPAAVRAGVVMLSSCEGGAHGASDGAEVLGLAAVLLARGATCVVAPLTAVVDRLCAEFVGAVHDQLAAGAEVGDALVAVRRGWCSGGDLARWAVAVSFTAYGADALQLAADTVHSGPDAADPRGGIR